MVNPCKSKLEKGILLPDGITWQSQAYEVVPIKERFLVEVSAAGGGWLEAMAFGVSNPRGEVPAGRFRLRPVGGSRAQLEALKGKKGRNHVCAVLFSLSFYCFTVLASWSD